MISKAVTIKISKSTFSHPLQQIPCNCKSRLGTFHGGGSHIYMCVCVYVCVCAYVRVLYALYVKCHASCQWHGVVIPLLRFIQATYKEYLRTDLLWHLHIYAGTLRQKLPITLAVTPYNSMLTLSQLVIALTV